MFQLEFFSMKPPLKKVSKYENKFAKLQKKAAEFNFRNQLKQVKKKEFTLEEEDKEVERSFFLNCHIQIEPHLSVADKCLNFSQKCYCLFLKINLSIVTRSISLHIFRISKIIVRRNRFSITIFL